MTHNQLDTYRTRCQARLETALDELLPRASVPPLRLHEAMR